MPDYTDVENAENVHITALFEDVQLGINKEASITKERKTVRGWRIAHGTQ